MKGLADLRKILRKPYGSRTENNGGQQGGLDHCRAYSDDGDRRGRGDGDMGIAIIVAAIDRIRVRQYQLYRLVDDLGDTRNAFGQDDERFSLIFRADKAPEVHL